MFSRYVKVVLILTSFLFTTGVLSLAVIILPATPLFTSGNVYKATAQFIIDQSIKKKQEKIHLRLLKKK